MQPDVHTGRNGKAELDITFPDSLTEPEVAQWREHCQCQRREGSFPLAQFKVELAKERARPELTEITANALDQLERWVETLSVEG